MAEVLSPATAMSASQRAKKVSMAEDEPALAAWITEVVETLNRPIGTVRVAKHHVTKVQEQLSDLRESGSEVDSGQIEGLIELLGKDVALCRRLKPDAFSLLIEVLLETKESKVRERGFYVLAKSLHDEAFDAQGSFAYRLDLVGQECLIQLYDQYVAKADSYGSRKWMGRLLMELIGDSEENQQIINMMSTSKRAKLGSAVLYESSEIMRAISGRVLTAMLAAGNPAKNFFPHGTSETLFEDYPGSTQPGSQWDNTFQVYMDKIWGDIVAHNDSGELQFAQNVATVPRHPEISVAPGSIYVEISDNVRVYMHCGNGHFDSALDIPLASIEDIETTLTLIDQAQSKEYVDVVLRLKPLTHCFVNSTQASLSVVRLTVKNQEEADGVREGIAEVLPDMTETRNAQNQVPATSPAKTDTQGSSQSRKSYGDENLILDGSYNSVVADNSFVALEAAMSVSVVAVLQEKEPLAPSVQESRTVAQEVVEHSSENMGDSRALDLEDPAPEGETSLSTTAIEVDVIKDVETVEVLSSKVLGMVVVPKVKRRPSVKADRPATEGAIEKPANGHGYQSHPFGSDDVEPEFVKDVNTPRPPKQAIKPKNDLTPIVRTPKKQSPKPKVPAKDSRDHPSSPQAAESLVLEKIMALPADKHALKSKTPADNNVHTAVAQEEVPTALMDAWGPLPRKQVLESEASTKASRIPRSGHHEEEMPVEPEKIVIPPAKKQALKSKTPIGVAKRKDDKSAELTHRLNKPTKASRLQPELQAASSVVEEEPMKTKLVALSKNHIKTAAGEGNRTKRPLDNDGDDEDIYDFKPSPPKVRKNVKTLAKDKKAAATTSVKGYGKKTKANNQVLSDEVEEAATTTKPSKTKKEPTKKKRSKQPVVPQTVAAAAPKRQTAPRSTKGKKSMKDLSDSEIENDEMLTAEEPKKTKPSSAVTNSVKSAFRPVAGNEASEAKVLINPAPIQYTKQSTIIVPDLEGEILGVQTSDTVHAHPEAKLEATSKPKVATRAIIGQAKANQDTTLVDTLDTQRWPSVDRSGSSSAPLIDDENPFGDPTTIASIERSDVLDMALTSTAEAQQPIQNTIEAKFGRKMAEIFDFASANAHKNAQQMAQNSKPPKDAEFMSGHRPAAVLEPIQHVDEFDNSKSAPSSKDDNKAIMEDDGFFVLSSSPNLTKDMAIAALHMKKEHSSADDPIVLSDPEEDDEDDDDEEESVAQVPVLKVIEERPILTPSAGRPAKRQPIAKEAGLSSPPRQAVPSPERVTVKAKAQAPKRAVPLPRSSPYVAATSEAGSSIDQSALLDDHQARKAPLISFGPHGPRNQGLSSGVKAARVSNEEKSNTLSVVLDDLSKRTAEKRPSPTQQASNVVADSLTRKPSVPSFEDSLARHDTLAMDIQPDEGDGLTFFDAGQSVSSSRSHSRVDVNGSPKARRAPLTKLGGPKFPKFGFQVGLKRDLESASNSVNPPRHTAPAEKASSRATFEDDTTLFGSGLFISSNRKARPAAPDDDLDFESRYTPHHAAKNGDYVGVADLKVIDVAPEITDPFSQKVTRQDSHFAQRLRLSQSSKAEREDKVHEPTAKAQAHFEPPEKPAPIHNLLTSVVDADADATLVDIESRRSQHRGRRHYHASSSDSSDSEAEAYGQRYETPQPDPRQIWRGALKSHQKDVSDVLHYVVEGMLQQLFDMEPAVYAIADEYRANGSKIIGALKSKMDAEIQGLHHRATSTIEDLAGNLRQSRAALKSESGAGNALDDQYKQWRSRQHALQSLPFMAREVGGRR